MRLVRTTEPLGLYIHWPFCRSKCPYCDFNSHVREVVSEAQFRNALLTELRWEADRLGARPLGSIFFGGGTPSLMSPETVGGLIAAAIQAFSATPDLEVTLEANPGSIEQGKLSEFRAAGVNRLSLGVQALNDAALRFLGRHHTVADAIAALELARQTFPRMSFDLIYARPGQSEALWRDELTRALDLAADHLSLYQLTIEPGTVFHTRHQRGEFNLPDGDSAVALYDLTTEIAARYQLHAYEVSNYARHGAECRHNLLYWRYGDYVGIGPGAHGRLDIDGRLVATRRHLAPEIWAERVARQGHGGHQEEEIAVSDRGREMLLMGLRLREGIDERRFAERTRISLDAAVDSGTLSDAIDEGYLVRTEGRLRATEEGRRRLDALLARLVR